MPITDLIPPRRRQGGVCHTQKFLDALEGLTDDDGTPLDRAVDRLLRERDENGKYALDRRQAFKWLEAIIEHYGIAPRVPAPDSLTRHRNGDCTCEHR